jgi:hypothetical protein
VDGSTGAVDTCVPGCVFLTMVSHQCDDTGGTTNTAHIIEVLEVGRKLLVMAGRFRSRGPVVLSSLSLTTGN